MPHVELPREADPPVALGHPALGSTAGRPTVIASFSRDVAFIKTHKTAGTSVEVVLREWCRPGDIVTPISASDERDFPPPEGVRPVTWTVIPSWREQRRAGVSARRAAVALTMPRLYNHMPAGKVRALFPDLWERGTTFAVDRHPYEKAVSYAFWRARHDPSADVSAVLDDVVRHHPLSDRALYTSGHEVIVSELVDFDRLWSWMADLAVSRGCSLPEPLPQAKSWARTDRTPAADLLTPEQKRVLRARLAFEFELFDFEP